MVPDVLFGRTVIFPVPAVMVLLPECSHMLSATRLIFAFVVLMFPPECSSTALVPVSVSVTPVGPVTLWASVMPPTLVSVTFDVELVIAPELLRVPLVETLASPAVALAVKLSVALVFEMTILPAFA